MPKSYRSLLSQLRPWSMDGAIGTHNRQTYVVFISLKCCTEKLYINRCSSLRTSHLCPFFYMKRLCVCGQPAHSGADRPLLKLCTNILDSEEACMHMMIITVLKSIPSILNCRISEFWTCVLKQDLI